MEGRQYHDRNDGNCPFCQQATSDAFAHSLNSYFDETFVADCTAIDALAQSYESEAVILKQKILEILNAPSKYLDVKGLKSQIDLLEAKFTINRERFEAKKKEAGHAIELESLNAIFDAIKSIIDSANTQIAGHNKMVSNISAERKALTAQVWRFVLEELNADLAEYEKKKGNLEKAITSIQGNLENTKTDRNNKVAEIIVLERQTTSVLPTIEGINRLLVSFGFTGFRLEGSSDRKSYKLVRADGTDAKTTLSEGEKTFVTFLYFFHLLKGSESSSGMTEDRIVVFDDPISSLDSDILFIVGSLIKGLFDEIRNNRGHIKQVFVFTHNVYFHKEVSYNSNRPTKARREETFWIVRKPEAVSKFVKCTTNPIKTSYELLWAEVRNPDRSNTGIQNTLRRILENYFKILGGVNLDELCQYFHGRDKIICKSLCSWINDGSHSVLDDLHVSVDDSTIDSYLKVFRLIFEKSKHTAHYEMMMGQDFFEHANAPVAAGSTPETAPAVASSSIASDTVSRA